MFAPPYDDQIIHTEIPHPRKTIYSKYIKRLLDVVLSGLAIIVLSPLFLVLCILELVYHGRPILYIDKRPGLNGEIFGLYKFRSMNNACDENGNLLHPCKRITPFGRVLRRTSLDELAGLQLRRAAFLLHRTCCSRSFWMMRSWRNGDLGCTWA